MVGRGGTDADGALSGRARDGSRAPGRRRHAGGRELRVRLSNLYGAAPVTFDAVDVAVRASGASAVPGTDRTVRFRSRRAVTIPAGREVVSDPVRLTDLRIVARGHARGRRVADAIDLRLLR